jgi:hypothetical protein
MWIAAAPALSRELCAEITVSEKERQGLTELVDSCVCIVGLSVPRFQQTRNEISHIR